MAYSLKQTHSLAGLCAHPDDSSDTDIRIHYSPDDGITFDWIRPFESMKDVADLLNNLEIPHISCLQGTLTNGQKFKLIDCRRQPGGGGALGHYKTEHWKARVLAISKSERKINNKVQEVSIKIDGAEEATDSIRIIKYPTFDTTEPLSYAMMRPRHFGSSDCETRETLECPIRVRTDSKIANKFSVTYERISTLRFNTPFELDLAIRRARDLRRFHSLIAGTSLSICFLTTKDEHGHTIDILYQPGFQSKPSDYAIRQLSMYNCTTDYSTLYWKWRKNCKELSALAAAWEYYDANNEIIESSLSAILFAIEGASRKAGTLKKSATPKRKYPSFSERAKHIISMSPGFSEHILRGHESEFIINMKRARNSFAHDLNDGPTASLENMMRAGRLQLALQALARHYILARSGVPLESLIELARSQHFLKKNLDADYI